MTTKNPIAAWAGKYVGLPWKVKGRTMSGCDCWGLVRLVVAEVCGVSLPSYDDLYSSIGPEAAQHLDALFSQRWPLPGVSAVARDEAKPGDVVLFRVCGCGCHVGVVCGDGVFLHIMPGANAVIDRFLSPRWACRVWGVYRCG